MYAIIEFVAITSRMSNERILHMLLHHLMDN